MMTARDLLWLAIGILIAWTALCAVQMPPHQARMKAFKLYRWWKGGRWVYCYNNWWAVFPDDASAMAGFVDHPGYGYHWTYRGIEKREDYRPKIVGRNYPPDYPRPKYNQPTNGRDN